MKTKIKNKAKLTLCIMLIACLVSMVGTSLMQSNGGKTKVTTFTGTLSKLASMIESNTAANGKKVDIQFTKDATSQFSFILLKPSNATAANPAPAIICAHGADNSKELQMSNYLELARRGYVVISIDMAGHGHSDFAIGGLTKDSYGMLAATEYAMSLDFVDNSKIGLTGHSLGQAACFATLTAINNPDSNNHIAAWLESSGSMPAATIKADQIKDLIYQISAGKYDEMDTMYFNSNTFLTTDMAKRCITLDFPAFNNASVPEGQWFTSDGAIAVPKEGTALGVKQAISILNPGITHPGDHFSITGSAITIKFFYDAFGVPTGANYIPSTNQVWYIATCFQLIGLLAFFGLLFPLVSLLLNTPLFAGLRQTERVREELPSIKSWKEWVPLVITLLALILYAFFSYFAYYNAGGTALSTATYTFAVPSNIAYWTMCCGLFAIAMICINYGMRKLFYLKDNVSLANPFESAKLDSVSHFFKILLFVACVVMIMFVPSVIAYYVFQVDFRICSLTAGMPLFRYLPETIFKYLPFWIAFYVPNAILNANTRYKELPEWATKLICAFANAIALVILIFIQYSTLVSTGKLWDTSSAMAVIVAFAVAPCLAYAAYSARYIYKKTGSAWIAGLMNATIMCIITCMLTWHEGLSVFPF